MTDCAHTETEPVEVGGHWGSATEVVARVCVACLERLPKNWGCPDCEWDTLRNMAGKTVATVCVWTCDAHALV